MKKFSKILLVLLALVATVTVFTVVALASEEDSEALTAVTTGGYDFEDKEFGAVFNDSASKLGKWTIGEADNGNKYIISEYATATGTNGDNWDISIPYSADYPVMDYPTFAFDFDVFSTNGAYHWSSTIRTDLYGGKYNGRITQMGSSQLTESGIKVPSVANEWFHVTYVVKHEGDGVFTNYFYVNGELTNTKSIDYKTTGFSSKDSRYTFTNWTEAVEQEAHEDFRISVISIYPPYRDSAMSEQIRYDNLKFSYYPASYSLDDVATGIYDENYEMPYGITAATLTDKESGNVTYYDDMQAAFEDANDTNVITLMADVEGIYEVNKAMTVNKNGYSFDYMSKTGYVPAIDGDVYEFTLAEVIANVVWDPACEDETCSCYAHDFGHVFQYSALVPLGYLPEYVGKTLTNDEGAVLELIGWSYENDGTADEITAVTAEQAAQEALYLYPVYKITNYEFAYYDANGEATFHYEGEFAEMLTTAIANAGSKIVLFSDVEYYKSYVIPKNTNVTVDLNGHNLTYVKLYGAVYNYDETVGDYVSGTEVTYNVKSTASAFSISTSTANINFTITSAKSGGAFRAIAAVGTAWYGADGAVERYEATSVSSVGFMRSTCPKDVYINLYNISLYAIDVIYNDHNGTTRLYLTMDNCKFYRTAGSEASANYGFSGFYAGAASDVIYTVKNSLLYFPSTSSVIGGENRLLRFMNGSNMKAIFENCDIISDTTSFLVRLEKEGQSAEFNNCRLYNLKNETAYHPTFGNDVFSTNAFASAAGTADGVVMVDSVQTVTYSLPTISEVTIDPETKLPVFNFAFADKEITFTKETKLFNEVYTVVTWVDEAGEVITTTNELKNAAISYPEYSVATGDGYKAILVTKWLDSENNDAVLEGLTEDTYTFKANPVIDENVVYVGGISAAMFSIVYYTEFHTVLYLPVVDGMNAPTVDGFEGGSAVKIKGVPHWAYTRENTTISASEDYEALVSFTKDGADYTDVITVSAIRYAETVLNNPENDAEKAAVANMVRYLKEARLALSLEVDEKFDELISLGELEALGASSEYADPSIDYSALGDYVESITFMVDGSFVAYIITLSDEAIAAGVEISAVYSGTDTAVSLSDSTTKANAKITNKTKAYDLTKAIEITITVPAAEADAEPTVVSGTYSANAYISATDNALVKAVYEFGFAVAAYRDYLNAL